MTAVRTKKELPVCISTDKIRKLEDYQLLDKQWKDNLEEKFGSLGASIVELSSTITKLSDKITSANLEAIESMVREHDLFIRDIKPLVALMKWLAVTVGGLAVVTVYNFFFK
jgi:hypothetical protein